MKFQVFAVFAAMVGSAIAQGVTEKITPDGKTPDGCVPHVDGKFEIAIIEAGNHVKRDLALQKRAACSGDGILVAELSDSVINDALKRTGYIASNYQFQFDGPPQAGALYTAGFAHCANGSLALGSSAVFYQCRSGNFYNLYDRWWAEQCEPVEILVMPCNEAAAGESNNQGQNVVGSSVVATTVVMPLSDGQPQVITTSVTVAICQITDGQIQGHTTPCVIVPTAATGVPPVSQFSDGQIQVTPVPGAPVSQISDGQIQVTPAPGAPQEAPTTSGPAVVPTAAPGVNAAASGGVGGALLLFAAAIGVVAVN